MTAIEKTRQMIENPSGKGRVFKKDRFIAEVFYDLRVFSKPVQANLQPGPIITGSLGRVVDARIVLGTEILTLHLQDNRKLDFICVNFDPDCEIASGAGFYT